MLPMKLVIATEYWRVEDFRADRPHRTEFEEYESDPYFYLDDDMPLWQAHAQDVLDTVENDRCGVIEPSCSVYDPNGWFTCYMDSDRRSDGIYERKRYRIVHGTDAQRRFVYRALAGEIMA